MRDMAFGHRTGLRVSEYGLGTANFGTGWGAGAEPVEARRVFDRFGEAGARSSTARTATSSVSRRS
ncbi:hypothetical protein [Streptomyces sp. NPDC053728]|uniref:hypothetical protein n=1 Tax=Streptomyces sp. NPDC053728 TaxID=3155534 RepID=UPI0034288023